MLPDRVLNPGPRTYESGALPIALRGPARCFCYRHYGSVFCGGGGDRAMVLDYFQFQDALLI